MKVYTSYFANRSLSADFYALVSIARTVPKGMYVPWQIDCAKPSAELLRDYKAGKVTWEQYVERYTNEVKDSLVKIRDMIKVYGELAKKPVVLLCWEGKGKPCHRHPLADMLNQEFGMEITEL